MTHYNRDYNGLPPEKKDSQAIADIKEYATRIQFSTLVDAAKESGTTIQQMGYYFGIVGIEGYPFHAFCRTYMLDRYRAWMADGDNPVKTDEKGFPLNGG